MYGLLRAFNKDVTVVTPGRLPEAVTYRATCGTCGCVFEWHQRPVAPIFQSAPTIGPTRVCPTTDCGTIVRGVAR